jgi:tripartite-type tricarboxylate transporter receptor subunit TctC
MGKALLKGVLSAAAAIVLAAPLSVRADYPDRPIRIIVPFGPGGITDVITRQLVKGMGEKLGQPFVVENKPGAGHMISLQTVGQAKPDGYTILVGSNTAFTITPHLYKNVGVNIGAFKPIAPMITSPTVLVARPDFPANNLSELVSMAKQKPGSLTYGSFGVASSAHLGMEIFMRDLGIDLVHVAYKGDAPVLMGLLGKEVDVAYITMFSAKSRIQSGEVKALGALQSERIPSFPSVQTTVETGSPKSDHPVWIALFAAPDTPDEIVRKLEHAARSVVGSAEFAEFVRGRGAEPMLMENAKLASFMEAQSESIESIVKEIGLEPN